MKKNIVQLFLGGGLIFASMALTCGSLAEDTITKDSMRGIYSSYKALQPFILKPDAFFAKENQQKISELVESLKAGFHTVDKFDKRFHSEPGFATNLIIAHDTLEQVSRNIKRGNPEYSLRLLKGVTNNCVTCHSTYKTNLNFKDTLPRELESDSSAKAQFLMATRQFAEAEKAFLDAARASDNSGKAASLLRQWLVIQTRIYDRPDDALKKLEAYLSSRKTLYSYEKEEIEDWLKGLQRWKKDSVKLGPLQKAKLLLRGALASPEPFYTRTSEVDLLRASGILHRGFADGLIKGSERGESMYLLGFTYSKLPLFFIDELPEIYFEECIRENPNSNVARSAYTFYKEMITLGYTGSSGVHIPGDVLAKLDDLYRIAFGIPAVPDRL